LPAAASQQRATAERRVQSDYDERRGFPGAQLEFYQSVIDRMGRSQGDGFARFFMMRQAGHRLNVDLQ
jgi:hypothetical protein